MTTQYEAPHVNGVLELSASKRTTLKNQLNAIITAFVPTHEQPSITTHYLVVEHTKKHGAQSTFTQLNGDTCEHILSFIDAEELVAPTAPLQEGTNPPAEEV